MQRLFILVFFLISVPVFSQRYETVTFGYWDNPAVWQNAEVPPHDFSDSVIIRHPVALQSGLTNNGFMRIEAGGALCGHRRMFVYGTMQVAGYFQLDSLTVDGGFVHLNGGANVLSYQSQVTNGGLLTLSGGSLAVGPWFECRDSDFFYMAGQEEEMKSLVHIVQQDGVIRISGVPAGKRIVLHELSGRLLGEKFVTGPETQLHPGNVNSVLILTVWNDDAVIFRSLLLNLP